MRSDVHMAYMLWLVTERRFADALSTAIARVAVTATLAISDKVEMRMGWAPLGSGPVGGPVRVPGINRAKRYAERSTEPRDGTHDSQVNGVDSVT